MRKGNKFKHRVLAWMLALAMIMTVAPSATFAAETMEPTEEEPQGTVSELSEKLQSLQTRIGILPTGDEYRAMTPEGQDVIYEMAAELSDEYFALSEEEQEKIDITKLEELFAVMNEDVALLAGIPHVHNSKSFSPGVGQGVLHSCSCYLVHDETVNNTTGIVVSGSAVTVDICLNGHTLDLGGMNIRVVNGATLNIYDCAGGGGKITGGKGATYNDKRGGAIYVQGSTLNIYGGTIEGNEAVWGGAIFIDGTDLSGKSTVNMYGGTICGNTAEKGGGGIEVENGGGFKDGKEYGSNFNMYGGSIINNTVTNTNKADSKYVHKGGGVHYADGNMSIQGKVNITGNKVAGKMDNVYLRNGVTLTVGKIEAGSQIGVSSFDVEHDCQSSSKPEKSQIITSGYGSNSGLNSVQCFYMDSLHDSENYALVLDGGELAIKRQTHTWQYEQVSGRENQIRAYCVNEDHTCAFKKTGSNTPTLTLNADNVIYSGEQYNGISYGEEEETKWTYAGLTMSTVQYTGTSADGVGDSASATPTNAGTYTASITVGGATATKDFTISPRTISDAVITLGFTKIKKNGTAIEQTIQSVSVSGISTGLSASTDYELAEDSAMKATDAGIHTVRINGKGNFKDSATAEWKITELDLMEGLTKAEPNEVYDGSAHSPAVSVTTPAEGYTVTYSTTENGTYTNEPIGFTDVGVHTVYYKIEHPDYEPETGTLTVTINPGTVHNITMGSVDYGRIQASVNGEIISSAGYGSEVTLIATPDKGYQFKQWVVSSGEITIDAIKNNKFTMPNSDVVMLAEFVEAPGSNSSSGGSDAPVAPTAPTEDYTIPVKNENTVKVEAEIKNGTANVSEITTDMIEKVVNNKDTQSKVDTITIDLSGAKQEVTGVTLSKTTVKTLAETTAEKDNGIETATIELSKATVVLDGKVLETLVEEAKGSQIELVVADTEQKNLNSAQQATLNEYQVATTFEAYFTSDGERIHDFKGGKAVVSIDFTPEIGKDTSYYHMVYVADNGELTRYKTKYQDSRLMFTTTHFSDYAVIYDTSEKNETGNDSGDTTVTLDTSYRTLRLRVPKSTKTTNVLKWTKVADADGYVIYGNKCNTKNKTYSMKKQVTIKNGSTTTWTDKNLTGGTYYKYYIKAYKLVDGKKVWLAKSKVVHSTTTGGKYGNAKSVEVNKTSVSLTAGKTFTIKAEQVVKDLPIKKHTEIKFESSNSKVATVNSNGVITAKKKGTCYIYVYAQNGMYTKVKVTVK